MNKNHEFAIVFFRVNSISYNLLMNSNCHIKKPVENVFAHYTINEIQYGKYTFGCNKPFERYSTICTLPYIRLLFFTYAQQFSFYPSHLH